MFRCFPGALVASLSLAFAAQAVAQRNPLAGDSKAAKAGEYEFRINCALCHGLGARGGGRGPDLTLPQRNTLIPIAEMFQVISNGIPGTAMPANGTNGQGVGMTDREDLADRRLHSQPGSESSCQADRQCRSRKRIVLRRCELFPVSHGPGQGRTAGTRFDWSGRIAHSPGTHRFRKKSQPPAGLGLTEPTKEFPQEYETVTAVTSDGKQIKGVTLNEDTFSLQIMDMSEQIHSLEKNKLRSFQKTRTSAMPKYGTDTLSDKDLDDVVAFLMTLVAK